MTGILPSVRNPTMSDWLPGAERISISCTPGLTLSTKSNKKIVFHSMETWGQPNWNSLCCTPHIDLNPREKTVRQYIPFSKGAYALASPGQPTSPNTNGGQVIQVEVAGYAAEGWSDEESRWIADQFLAIADEIGMESREVEGFGGDETYGSGPHRLSWDEYFNFSGLLGHQSVPYNSHWDPGAGGNLVKQYFQEGDGDMPLNDDDIRKVANRVNAVLGDYMDTGKPRDPDQEDPLRGNVKLQRAWQRALDAEDEARAAKKQSQENYDAIQRLVDGQNTLRQVAQSSPWLIIIVLITAAAVAGVVGFVAGHGVE